MYLKAYIQNLVNNGLVVSEKNKFRFPVADLSQESRRDLDLENSMSILDYLAGVPDATYHVS